MVDYFLPHLSGCPQLGYAEIINLAAREEGKGQLPGDKRGPGLKKHLPAPGICQLFLEKNGPPLYAPRVQAALQGTQGPTMWSHTTTGCFKLPAFPSQTCLGEAPQDSIGMDSIRLGSPSAGDGDCCKLPAQSLCVSHPAFNLLFYVLSLSLSCRSSVQLSSTPCLWGFPHLSNSWTCPPYKEHPSTGSSLGPLGWSCL